MKSTCVTAAVLVLTLLAPRPHAETSDSKRQSVRLQAIALNDGALALCRQLFVVRNARRLTKRFVQLDQVYREQRNH